MRGFLLSLTLGFGSMPVYAGPVYFDLFFDVGGALSGNNTSLDVRIFLDDADIPSIGLADVNLSAVDVVFMSTSGDPDISFSFPNDRTDTVTGSGVFNTTFVPFKAKFDDGVFQWLTGTQPVGHPGIAHLIFGNFGGPLPIQSSTLFQSGAAFGEANGTKDNSFYDGNISGPFSVTSVPEPTTLTLLLGSLGVLGIGVWRRK